MHSPFQWLTNKHLLLFIVLYLSKKTTEDYFKTERERKSVCVAPGVINMYYTGSGRWEMAMLLCIPAQSVKAITNITKYRQRYKNKT